ncbi:MAG: hypothetical protein LBK97_00570 [Prevotellaceae bacterium]|nr:hypothetical protein [Prevotellaceae bacterium]
MAAVWKSLTLTCRALTDEFTGLYQKPWIEVYQLLLRELKLGKKYT